MQTVTCDVVAIFATRSLAPGAQSRPGRFPTSYCCSPTAFEIRSLPSHQIIYTKQISHQLLLLTCRLCVLPSHEFRPGEFLTSYCCSPTASEICILSSHKFGPGRFSYQLLLLIYSFVPCHSTSFGQADFSPATSAHLHPVRKFRQKTWNFESRKNPRHATKLARIVAREMSLRGKVVAATHRLVCKGP